MKTDNSTRNNPQVQINWINDVTSLSEVTCLPITNCQTPTPILSNWNLEEPKSSEIIVIENVGIIPSNSNIIDSNGSTLNSNYAVYDGNKSDLSSTNESSRSSTNDAKSGNNFEDMLYFVCNLCPFLCTKQTKITDHLKIAHKNNKNMRKHTTLKCPACSNIFFHKMSLRSHLIHDHGVGNSDLNQIIQAVVHYANKAKNSSKQSHKANAKNVVGNGTSLLTDPIINDAIQVPDGVIKSMINLPKGEIATTKTEQNFHNMMAPNNSSLMMNSVNQGSPNSVSKLITSKKKQKCTIPGCKVIFQNVDNLSYHINCHRESGFICLVCKESFSFWKSLSSHLWRLHKIDMELYSCDKCNYKSVSLAKLNNIHKLIHGDVRAFICGVCKKAFKNSKQLGNHKITHRNEREREKFSCDVCLKTFSDGRQLRIHMNVVHEKVKPYLCNYCGYKGSSRSALKMHVRQHTGEKPFACDSCSYTTADHNSLRRHKLRHSGEKPYKCTYCSYACIQSSTYKVHLKTKHPGQEKDLMFTCPDCQFKTVNKDIYKSHMVTVHEKYPKVMP